MPQTTPVSVHDKARRIDHALRTERDTLRGRGNVLLANTLNNILLDSDDDTKARLCDLVTNSESPEEALARVG